MEDALVLQSSGQEMEMTDDCVSVSKGCSEKKSQMQHKCNQSGIEWRNKCVSLSANALEHIGSIFQIPFNAFTCACCQRWPAVHHLQ